MNDLKFTIKDCDDVVKQCLKIDNVQTVDFEIIPRHRNNYIFKITCEYDSEKKTLCLYAKSKSKPPKIDRILYQDFKGALEGFNPKITPKFHCGKSELLFFEDLTCQKFQTNPNLFDLKHVHQVLNVLAKVHAASFAYEEVKSKKLNEEYQLQNSNFDLNEAEDLLWTCADNKERVDEVKFELEQRHACSQFEKTLCHGNLTSANILFHYNNGAPDECKLVNFEGNLYAPPVYDVLQVIFLNTSEEFRQQNFDDLLSYYYSHLREETEKYRLNIDSLISSEDFRMSSHYILPLIKVEAGIWQKKNCKKNYQQQKTIKELKEILSFPALSREDCYVIVKNAIKSLDYELLCFKISFLETGNRPVHSSKLTIKIRHFIEEKIINCFVVHLSREEIVKQRYFNKETFIYKLLLSQLQQYGISGINSCLPQCYFQRFKDLMVFEDMAILNFRSLLTLNCSDFSLLSIVTKKLAKLHSCSIIFEEKMSEKMKTTYHMIDYYEDHLKENLFSENRATCSEKLMNLLFEIINLFPELKTNNAQENLKKCAPKLSEIFCAATTYSDRFRNVICHGDIKTSNILVQFDDDMPIDCRFVNCESVKYRPPAYDFLCAIYSITNQETRIKNEETLKQIYTEELEKNISSHNYTTDKIFSYQEFLDSVEFSRPQIILRTIIYNTFILCAPQDISSVLTTDAACEWMLSKDLNVYLPKVDKQADTVQKLRENVIDLYEICQYMLPNL